MAEALLKIEGLSKRFGGVVASDNIVLDVRPRELHAVIGPNGAGKTTLIGELTGEVAPDAGRIYFDDTDITSLPVYRRSRSASLARSRSRRCFSISPPSTTWHWPCRRMPGTLFISGERPARKALCASPH